jgi:hypothetical protein
MEYGNKKDLLVIEETRFKGGKDAKLLIERLKKQKKDFYVRETNFITIVVCDNMEMIYPNLGDKRFPPNQLWLFGRVKQEAENFLRNNPKWKMPKKFPTNVTNYNYDDSFGDITGTDINGAYWQIAFNEGYISKNTYDKASGEEFKRTRLAALAILGRNIAYSKYSKGVIEPKKTIFQFNQLEVHLVYKAIRFKCFEIMQRLAKMLGEDFEAYRTDCIYYRDTPKNRAKVHKFLEKKGFSYKQLVYD